MTAQLDIIIPVFNEGQGIERVLETFQSLVKTPFSVSICYDREDDTTLAYLKPFIQKGMRILTVKNKGTGPHRAVRTGFEASQAPYVLVFPADDTSNARILDGMVEKARRGAQIVCASRFMKGGSMVGCPWLKAVLVRLANFTLYHVARLPTHDSTNGLRLFSRQAIDTIPLKSTRGFTFSLELLVKSHRRGWKIEEVPAVWIERSLGKSRFKVISWLPAYLRWYFYAFATTFLGRRT